MTDAEKKVLDEEVVVESVDVEVGTMEDVDAIMKKFDRESNHPCLGGHAEEDPALCAGRLYALYGLHEPVGHLERPDPPLPVRRLCDPVHILYLPREEGQCKAQLHAVV